MAMTRNQMLIEVAEELLNIKTKATPSELSRLNASNFKNSSSDRCIYGQMTGSYKNSRAVQITPKKYNGVSSRFETDKITSDSFLTILEKYINYFESDKPYIKTIFDFLKGETSSITLKLDGEQYTCYVLNSGSSAPVKSGIEIHQVKEFKF